MPLTFLVPALLAGLAAIAIPVLLHLRRRERERPTRFPSLMFLQRVTVTTARRRRITDWPLLLLRAVIVALAVLAFARPVLRPRSGALPTRGMGRLVIALDRSMSMSRTGVWTVAQDSARQLVKQLGAGDRVAVVAFDERATVEQPLTLDHAAALAAIARLRPGSGATRYGAAIRAAGELLDEEAGVTGGDVVLISDLQRTGATGIAGASLPARVRLRAIAVSPGAHGNASITGVDVHRVVNGDSTRPRLAVAAQIASQALPATRPARVTLTLNGRVAATRDIVLPPDGTTTVAFTDIAIPVSAVQLTVSLTPDSLAADDVFRAVVPSQLVRRVIVVAPADMPADQLFYVEQALDAARDPALRVDRRNASTLNAVTLRDALAVILDDTPVPGGAAGDALAQYVHDGGGVIAMAGSHAVSPSTSVQLLPGVTRGMIDRTSDGGGIVGVIAIEHPVFAPFHALGSASLRTARFFRYPRLTVAADAQILARFDDGLPAVLEREEGAGHVLLLAMPLDATSGDFPLQPAYLPFVRAMVLYAGGANRSSLWSTVGDAWTVPPALRAPVIRTPLGALLRPEPVRGTRTVTFDEAGFYTLYDQRAAGDPVAVVAVNPAARESDLTAMHPSDVLVGVRQDSLAPGALHAATLAEAEGRQRIWRTLLLVVVLALAGETWMASRGWRGTAARVVGPAAEGSQT